MTTMTSREFNQDAGRAKRAAQDGPVFITDRGKPAHVLLTIEEYRKLSFSRHNLAEALACPEAETLDFEPQKLPGMIFKAEDLS
ncbi:MAG: type II toxin-antitoxin system Phd/YefM family antitoxin [Desulfovibrionaceae bacterium]|nr:type II toxin-antitoxin system Phd/YefM family antitoxin [Desulfovibrionaceae bacterium]